MEAFFGMLFKTALKQYIGGVFLNVKWEEGTKEEFQKNVLIENQQDIIYSLASEREKQN